MGLGGERGVYEVVVACGGVSCGGLRRGGDVLSSRVIVPGRVSYCRGEGRRGIPSKSVKTIALVAGAMMDIIDER